jgi:RHS repeat-associated protein
VTDSFGTYTGTSNAQDQLISYGPNSYTYNANGELTGKTVSGQSSGTAYSYDSAGNLLGVTLPNGTVISYVLDGRGRRIGKEVNGHLVQGFLYDDALRPVAELDGNNQLVSRFVYTSDTGAPAYMIKGGVEYRIITDQAGSVRLVVDAQDGSIAQQIQYDAFGRVLSDSNPGFQPFGFGGGLYDRDTGLVHFGARDYDPETGRWLTRDPLQFGGGDVNLYGYVVNDPVDLSDPTGAGPLQSALNAIKPLKAAAVSAVTAGDARRHAIDVLASDPAHAPDSAINAASSGNLIPALQGTAKATLDSATGTAYNFNL